MIHSYDYLYTNLKPLGPDSTAVQKIGPFHRPSFPTEVGESISDRNGPIKRVNQMSQSAVLTVYIINSSCILFLWLLYYFHIPISILFKYAFKKCWWFTTAVKNSIIQPSWSDCCADIYTKIVVGIFGPRKVVTHQRGWLLGHTQLRPSLLLLQKWHKPRMRMNPENSDFLTRIFAYLE